MSHRSHHQETGAEAAPVHGDPPRAAHTDPVCGMALEGLRDLRSIARGGRTVFFCSAHCEARFSKNPSRFEGTPQVALRGVVKTFRRDGVERGAETHVLTGLDLHIWEGDFVALVGPSGSGKSTTLNMIGLLDTPTAGAVFIRGENVAGYDDAARAALRARTFGFVFQQYNLIPWLTAYENAFLPRLFARMPEDAALADRFRAIDLAPRMSHRPSALSGGEQQRVALLRALANDPAIVLCDEPTGNLDSVMGKKILELLTGLNKKQGKTLVIVTHDISIAEQADQVIAVKDGRVIREHHANVDIYTR